MTDDEEIYFVDACEDACAAVGIFLTAQERLMVSEMECEGLTPGQAPVFIRSVRGEGRSMTLPDMSPALRDHMRDLHFIAHQTLGIGKLTDEHRERIHRAVHYGESMGWKPTHIGEEPPF